MGRRALILVLVGLFDPGQHGSWVSSRVCCGNDESCLHDSPLHPPIPSSVSGSVVMTRHLLLSELLSSAQTLCSGLPSASVRSVLPLVSVCPPRDWLEVMSSSILWITNREPWFGGMKRSVLVDRVRTKG